ncbi:hypothetical protein M902_1836 [Bacteriovorax sp. BAL6_X]|uniref:hypothetical protein n=1 Tax=Bacteriovorax sp. BAL6_X TaxID=1201290 RepID=UPI000385E7D3|nr:hypothetical protein [Bacteriovorax sp. BAL6_X]EPZ51703.1 hypothetical protein M902_1836 [Bacteriovorax sp. BAL6_X]
MKAKESFLSSTNSDTIYFAYTSNLNSKVESHNDELIVSSKIQFGGDALLYKFFSAIREKLSNLIVIDGGQILEDKYDLAGELILGQLVNFNYDAILLTDHELTNLKNKLIPHELPFVNSNLISLDTNSAFTQYGNQEYIIKEVGGIKVGIIGLTPYKPKLKKEDGLEGILFDDIVARVIEIKKQLRGKTDLNIALLHSHTECSDTIDYRFKNCSLDKEATETILKRLPPDTFDLIFTGNSFEPHTQVSGYPIISNLGHGEFITLVGFNKKTKKVKAEQIRVCSHFYQVIDSCYIDPEDIDTIKKVRKSRLKLKPATVFGKEIL